MSPEIMNEDEQSFSSSSSSGETKTIVSHEETHENHHPVSRTSSRIASIKFCALGLVLGIFIIVLPRTETPTVEGGGGESMSLAKSTISNTESLSDPNTVASWPRIAWLMSFPNSGTSYTIGLVRSSSLLYTASNYGEGNIDKNLGISIPVFKQSPYGPFWSDPGKPAHPSNMTLRYPDHGYIMTKTHCGSRCMDCKPSRYLTTQHQFLIACLSGKHVEKDKDGNKTIVKGHYDASLVKKAIHLIRNPFNNAVSRFHLHIKHKQDFSPGKQGFRAFCAFENEKFESEEEQSKLLEGSILEIIRHVPCHAEFIRYVRWHNAAFTVTKNLQLPTLVVHYESYETNFNHTLGAILDFLGHKRLGKIREFLPGHSYLDYYSENEMEDVYVVMKELAFIDTWSYIRHYFGEDN